jgi:tRNA (adenine22-N1)-methyltransferase
MTLGGILLKLDNRLRALANMTPPGKRIADIGTDHAYLPVCLMKEGRISSAIAADINKGPCMAAQKTVKDAGLQRFIETRMGDGLAVISPGEADILVIAGMGGGNIVSILSEHPHTTSSFERLIVQPMTGAALVRRYFSQNGWQIVDEELVLSEKEDKFYQIIAAEKGYAPDYESILEEIGPLLWERRHPHLKKFLAGELSHLKNVAANMAKSCTAVHDPKYYAHIKKIKAMEDKLLCL